MDLNRATFPRRVVWTVWGLSALPLALKLLGADFGTSDPGEGALVHALLEWTAFTVALVTVAFSFLHFSIRRDVTTPIVGTALFFSGTMDAFHALAAAGLIPTVSRPQEFIPFTWAISRVFNVTIMILGTSLFLGRGGEGFVRTRQRGGRFVLLVGLLFGLEAYSIVHICALAPRLPQAIFPDAIVPRPWDAIPLVLFLVAGGLIFPRFHRRHPSVFSHALVVSVVPHVAAELHAAFGSRELYDGDAHRASALKILAYLVPLVGLSFDYVRAYQAEAALRSAEEKLRVAREVQRGLLPKSSPAIAGFDLAGVSLSADVMGGDYFDYLPMSRGRWGIVVADVSGHDISAAALMAQTRAWLRAAVRQQDDPGTLLTELNRFVASEVAENRFVSAFFARLDPATRTVAFAAAGHQAHLVSANGAWRELEATGPVLGGLCDQRISTGGEFVLAAGETLVCLTDGVLEASSPEGAPFGIDQTRHVLATVRQRPAGEVVEAVLEGVRGHLGGAGPQDDLTIVVLRAES